MEKHVEFNLVWKKDKDKNILPVPFPGEHMEGLSLNQEQNFGQCFKIYSYDASNEPKLMESFIRVISKFR